MEQDQTGKPIGREVELVPYRVGNASPCLKTPHGKFRSGGGANAIWPALIIRVRSLSLQKPDRKIGVDEVLTRSATFSQVRKHAEVARFHCRKSTETAPLKQSRAWLAILMNRPAACVTGGGSKSCFGAPKREFDVEVLARIESRPAHG